MEEKWHKESKSTAAATEYYICVCVYIYMYTHTHISKKCDVINQPDYNLIPPLVSENIKKKERLHF